MPRSKSLSPASANAHLRAAARELSPSLAADLAALGPLRLPSRSDWPLPLYLARAVVGQQLSTKAAASIWNRLTAAMGEGDFSEFVGKAADAQLRAVGLSAAKVKALRGIGRAAERGELDGAALLALDSEERARHLMRLPGVGRWTADMTAIFHYGDPDIWPEGDLTVRKGFAGYIGRRNPLKAVAPFRPYRSFLAVAMWKLAGAKF